MGHAAALPACEPGEAFEKPLLQGDRAGTKPAHNTASALPAGSDPPGLAGEAGTPAPERAQSGHGPPANGHAQRRAETRPAAEGGAVSGGEAAQRSNAGQCCSPEALETLPLLRCGLADVAALETHWAKAAPEWRGAVGAACAELAAAAAAAGGYAPGTPAQLQVHLVCAQLMLVIS